MLGHSSVNVTVDIYGHLMEKSYERVSSAIGRQNEDMPDAIGETVHLVQHTK